MSDPAAQPVRDALRGNPNPGENVAPSQPDQSAGKPEQSQQPDQQQTANPTHSVIPEDVRLERSRVAPGMYKPVPEIKILEWQSAARPFKQRNKQFFVTVSVIALLVSLILFFSGQFLPIAVVISVVFLLYVLQVIPPHEVKHEITTYGIKIEGNLYYWEEMGRFWFEKKHDQLTLNIEVLRFPGRITMVVPEEQKQEVTEILSEVLLQQKPDPTFYERTASWFQEKIPLE
jgi:hypothetical protein